MCQCIVLVLVVVDHWWLAGSPLLTRDCSRQGIHHSNLWYKFSPTESYHFSHCFFWQNPPICKFPCHSQNSLKDLHFVIFMFEQRKIISALSSLNSGASIWYFSGATYSWTSVRNIIALLGFQLQIQLPAKVFFATLDKSFFWLILIELGVLFKVEIFFGRKYFNNSNITLPNPVGNENSIVLGILRTDCVPALIFQALVDQIWAG